VLLGALDRALSAAAVASQLYQNSSAQLLHCVYNLGTDIRITLRLPAPLQHFLPTCSQLSSQNPKRPDTRMPGFAKRPLGQFTLSLFWCFFEQRVHRMEVNAPVFGAGTSIWDAQRV
jgi:hypothetical protein